MSPYKLKLFVVGTSLLSLGAALTGAAFAYEPPSTSALEAAEPSFLMRPGVVVDPAASVLYVMQDDGVAAYSTTGERLWRSAAAERPLGLYGDQLVAITEPGRKGRAELALLDARQGDLLTTISVPLPEGVAGWVVERPDGRFDAAIHVVDNRLSMSWTFVSRPLRGAAVAGIGEVASVPSEQTGAVYLDATSGTSTPVKLAASRSFRFDVEPEARVPGLPGRQFRAGDDGHVLGSNKLGTFDGWNSYRWTIVDRAGQVLGSVERPVSTAPFYVAGSTLIHEDGPTLRRAQTGEIETHGLRLVASQLDGDRPLWSLDLRDTSYRGVLPP